MLYILKSLLNLPITCHSVSMSVTILQLFPNGLISEKFILNPVPEIKNGTLKGLNLITSSKLATNISVAKSKAKYNAIGKDLFYWAPEVLWSVLTPAACMLCTCPDGNHSAGLTANICPKGDEKNWSYFFLFHSIHEPYIAHACIFLFYS